MREPGTFIGPYLVLSILGEGGMATVYLADDTKHGRNVAIKVMKPAVAEAIGQDRFIREIETVARLTHPHILPLHDSGTADGLLYYVMPYIAGASLRARLETEPRLPIEEAVRLTREIGSALAHAHTHGHVHRDVKPENVLLADGIALVADFGLARETVARVTDAAATHALRLTQAGVLLGTPLYMAPEQGIGEHPIDGRADMYALACVLFEMLTGQPPFLGSTSQALLLRHAADPVPPLHSLRPGVPDSIVAAIEKALAKSPDDRFATVTDFTDALMIAPERSSPMPRPAHAATVAVLPFQNVGGSAEDGYLSDGICDELIHTLGRIDGIRVTARGSSFLFRERRDDIRTIGAQLNVGVILDGTVRRSGKRLRVTAQLINVSDGFQFWSERYDREVDDVFALEEDIAGAIAEVLRVRLVGGRTTAANFEAYERYLKGVYHWNRRTPQDMDVALGHLAVAVQRDDSFAPAWGAMALCYVTLGLYGMRAPDEVFGLARAASNRALRLDRSQADALTARACVRAVHDWDFSGAERDFADVIASSPSNATAHQWYATNLLAPQGRFDEARASLVRALELDPLSPSIIVSAGLVAYVAGDPPAALLACERALTLDPNFSAARYFLGAALASAGRYDDAIASLEAAAAGMGDSPEVLAALGTVCAMDGRQARAEMLLRKLTETAEKRYVSPMLTAIIHIGLGDLDAAFADVERGIDLRASEVIWLDVRPVYAPLRRDPRFATLTERRRNAGQISTATQAETNH